MRQLTTEDYKKNVGLIHSAARRCFGRIAQTGVAMDYNDVFQFQAMVFVDTWSRFNPELGFKFSTYFMRAAMNEWNRHCEKPIAERLEHGVRSIEELQMEDDSTMSAWELIASEERSPEEDAMTRQRLEQLRKNYSPLTALVVEWLINPPAELMHEVRAKIAHANYAINVLRDTSKGRARTDLSIQGIIEFLTAIAPDCVSPREVRRARKELNQLMGEAQ